MRWYAIMGFGLLASTMLIWITIASRRLTVTTFDVAYTLLVAILGFIILALANRPSKPKQNKPDYIR